MGRVLERPLGVLAIGNLANCTICRNAYVNVLGLIIDLIRVAYAAVYGARGRALVVIFSERELKFMFAICRRPSICRLSVVCLSVMFVRPTQTIEIFGNVFMPFGTLAIHDLSVKILWRSSQGNPSVGGVKHKRGSRI